MRPDPQPPSAPSAPSAQDLPPELAGVRFGPRLAAGLYLLLVASAVLALWVLRFPGQVHGPLEAGAPWLFLVFVVAFALYRLQLVRARRYPASKAFFQVGAGVLFFTLLLPGARTRFERPPEGLASLLTDSNPRVRALAAEVARHRAEGQGYLPVLARAMDDPDREVRTEAHRSLVQLSGMDLGGPESPGAARAWRDKYP